MRSISPELQRRLASKVQAGDTSLNASLWVSRPNNPLTENLLLEKQHVITASGITKSSVAACHPRKLRDATDVYVGYVDSGTVKVSKASYKHKMSDHNWIAEDFYEPGEDVSLCFDGTMPRSWAGKSEFVTEESPWVFWISGGALYARLLGTSNTITLAEANCTAVSAVRAVWSSLGGFDFGLVVFFIIGGYLYYRQLINGEWYDAELVTADQSGTLWSDVSAFRTWDYRVGAQLLAQDGSLHEIFTQFMGIGKQSSEHIELRGATSRGNLTPIQYSSGETSEHVELAGVTYYHPYRGLYTLGIPSLKEVYNVDSGQNDWGKLVVFVFDKELNYSSVLDSMGSFYFVDSADRYYFPASIEMDNTGRKAVLSFVDINNAVGSCTAHYSPGVVITMVDELLPAQECPFTPQNLVPNDRVFPEIVDIWSTKEDGTEVALKFTESLTVVPVDSFNKFLVTISEPEYVPGGSLSTKTIPVIGITQDSADPTILYLSFEDGMYTSIRNAVGPVIIQYVGTTLEGANGPVLGFRKQFLPEGLYMKPNPHNPEHLTVERVSYTDSLRKIEYRTFGAGTEHVELTAVSWSGALTHIDDI